MIKIKKTTVILLAVILVSIIGVSALTWVKLGDWGVEFCFDSDGGLDESIKGKIDYKMFGNKYFVYDFCNDTNYLVEYTCSGTEVKSWGTVCDCINGKCI